MTLGPDTPSVCVDDALHDSEAEPMAGGAALARLQTVDTYRARVMEKLGMTHRSELVRMAVSAGLLQA